MLFDTNPPYLPLPPQGSEREGVKKKKITLSSANSHNPHWQHPAAFSRFHTQEEERNDETGRVYLLHRRFCLSLKKKKGKKRFTFDLYSQTLCVSRQTTDVRRLLTRWGRKKNPKNTGPDLITRQSWCLEIATQL